MEEKQPATEFRLLQDNADKFQHNKDLTECVEDAGAFRAPTNAEPPVRRRAAAGGRARRTPSRAAGRCRPQPPAPSGRSTARPCAPPSWPGPSSASGCPGPPRPWRCGPWAASCGARLRAAWRTCCPGLSRPQSSCRPPSAPAQRAWWPGRPSRRSCSAEVPRRPPGRRLAQRARPGRLRLPAHVGLQRLEGHGLRHVEVALPCESVQLPRVPHVEVVGQVPQRLHLKNMSNSLDAGRPAHSVFLLVLRPPLGLPGFHLVQPGLEALAHPPEHAGEARVVEGDHLSAVAPPGGARQVLPLRSCEVV